jgi:hypothetical protein
MSQAPDFASVLVSGEKLDPVFLFVNGNLFSEIKKELHERLSGEAMGQ